MAANGFAVVLNFDIGVVMGTLAEALVATAIGLLVAIPAVAAFNYFQRRVKGILSSTETLSHVVMASLAAEEKSHVAPRAEVKDAKEPSKEASKESKSERASKSAVAEKD